MNTPTLTIRQDMTVDSRTVATGCGIEHESAMRLLTTHQEAIESELGKVTFEMRLPEKAILGFKIGKPSTQEKTGHNKGGRPERIAYLTEDQATALVTLCRNTPQVVRFKVALTKAFGELKRGKLPTYGDLARMVLQQEAKLGIAGDIFAKILPDRPYGSIAPSGQPRIGVRRASFVAAKNRINEAVDLLRLSAQMELAICEGTK